MDEVRAGSAVRAFHWSGHTEMVLVVGSGCVFALIFMIGKEISELPTRLGADAKAWDVEPITMVGCGARATDVRVSVVEGGRKSVPRQINGPSRWPVARSAL